MAKKNSSIYIDSKTYNSKTVKKHPNVNKTPNIIIEGSLKTVNNDKSEELRILKDELYRECVRLRELISQESKRKGYVF